MPTRLTGHPTLAYKGVEAPQPPNIVAIRRAPTVNDYLTFNTGDLWINIASLSNMPPTAPTAEDIWMLVSKNKKIANATWVNFAGGGAGTVGQFTADAGANPVLPDGAGNVNIFGGPTLPGLGPNAFTNINTFAQLNTIRVDLNNSIIQPFTSAAGTEGVYSLGVTGIVADRFMHAYGTNNTFLGRLSGNLTLTVANASNNTCIGRGTCTALVGTNPTEAQGNTVVGSLAGAALQAGGFNTLIGSTAGNAIVNSQGNCAVGTASLILLTGGGDNSCLGSGSGRAYNANESDNVVIGVENIGRVGENNTIRIGAIGQAAGTNNIFIGRDTGTSAYTVATAIDNTFVGSAAGGAALTTGDRNTMVGSLSGSTGITTGNRNNFFGYQAGSNYTGAESGNICIGEAATGRVGESSTLRINNTQGLAGGTSNIFIGGGSGNNTYTIASAIFNQCVGTTSLVALTTGSQNCAFGNGSLESSTTASSNCAFGTASLQDVTTGGGHAAFGDGALANVVTGVGNTAIGFAAGTTINGAESYNIYIGNGQGGTIGDNNTMRIGNGTGAGATNLNAVFIAGINGINVAGVNVVVDGADQLGIIVSSKRYKNNIEDMEDYSCDIMNLRPVTFSYKNDSAKSVSVGLIAEEVEEMFSQLVVKDQEGLPMTVRYNDLIPMLLNEIQKLEKRVKELEKKCQTWV